MNIFRGEHRTFPCNCCGFWTLDDPASGSYEICPVCYWEDDPVQNVDPLYANGANNCTLNMARQNYIDFGACEDRFVNHVRSPARHEIPSFSSSSDSDTLTRGLKSAILTAGRSILSHEIDAVEGCSFIARLVSALNQVERQPDSLLMFKGFVSELDGVLIEDVRDLWESEALARKDAEASAYVTRMLPSISKACKILEIELGLRRPC